jgi:hypothetical protein
MKIIPQKGDYVKTEGMSDDQYHAIAEIFLLSGSNAGEYRKDDAYEYQAFKYFGIDIGCKLYHHDLVQFFSGRELSINDLLGDDECSFLPNVGDVVDQSNNGQYWQTVEIKYKDDFIIFYANKMHAGNYWMSKIDDPSLKFRPIKSERELAIESIIETITHGKTVNNGYRHIAESIYDAGWRKV